MASSKVNGICRALYGEKWYKCARATKAVRKSVAEGTLLECGTSLIGKRAGSSAFDRAVLAAFVAIVDEKKCAPGYGMATLLWWPHDNCWVMMNCAAETCYVDGDGVMGYLDPWYLLEQSLINNCTGTVRGTGYDEAMTWGTNPLELYVEKSAWVKLGPEGQKRVRTLVCPCCSRKAMVVHTNSKWPSED